MTAMVAEKVSVNPKPFENGRFLLGVQAVGEDGQESMTVVYELSSIQLAKLAMDAHTVEMTDRGVQRPKKRFGKLRKWLLVRI